MVSFSNKHEEFFDFLIANAENFEKGAQLANEVMKDMSRISANMDLAGPKARISAILVRGGEARIQVGDMLFLASGAISNYPDEFAGDFVMTCSIPEIFQHLQVGDPVLIDEGKLKAQVAGLTDEGAYLKVTYTKPKGGRIKGQKSLNFPQTDLDISPLTQKDLADLDFVAAVADAIGYSFVKRGADIKLLQDELKKRRGNDANKIVIIAKIETKEAVSHLPEIIVQAASQQPLGIMTCARR